MRIVTSVFGLLTVQLGSDATAQTAAPAPQSPPPCSAVEYRQLDFWVGEWIAEWTNPDGTRGTGRNVITKNEYGSCVITERFQADDGSLKGFSISTYFKPSQEWRQTWMDDQGGYFDLFGGPSTEPRRLFALETYRRKPAAPHSRMVWEDVQPNKFTWRWQGRKTAEETWADKWVITYTRTKATPGTK